LKHSIRLLPATVLFRWYNRIETGETLFLQEGFLNGATPFECSLMQASGAPIVDALKKQAPPYVTGAYTINSRGTRARTKHEGVAELWEIWLRKPWESFVRVLGANQSLAVAATWIQEDAPCLGSFMSAQIVADIKYAPLLDGARDWSRWAASGTGSRKGLNILLGRKVEAHWKEEEWLAELQDLQTNTERQFAKYDLYLHAQDLQNCLCEFYKYEKTRLGLGRPRGVFP
jgi:hypothetical protein